MTPPFVENVVAERTMTASKSAKAPAVSTSAPPSASASMPQPACVWKYDHLLEDAVFFLRITQTNHTGISLARPSATRILLPPSAGGENARVLSVRQPNANNARAIGIPRLAT